MSRQIEIATKTAWAYIGRPYKWGGDDPLAGFDCSGFVIELLRSAGILPRDSDWTAAGLKRRFKSVATPREGCLVFYANAAGEIVHVEYCLDSEYSIGAGGGGSSTITVQDAVNQNAYVRVRTMASRNGLAGYVDPFMV